MTMFLQKKGLALILSGPSGAGKSTVLNAIRPRWPEMTFSVSWTTRPPRPGEVNDVHYHFATQAEFKEAMDNHAFLEWANVHGGFYGTPKARIFDIIRQGGVVFLDIDVQGARQIRASVANTEFEEAFVYVFIAPPDMVRLEARLRGRQTDSEEAILKRLANARKEMEAYREYQYVIINDQVEEAAQDLNAIIRSARCRTM